MDGKHHLGTLDLLKLSLRIFKTRPMRTLLTILGMSVGIGAVLFLVSLGYGLQFILIGRLVTTEDSLITLDIVHPSELELNINSEELNEIAQIPEVGEISAVAEFPGELRSDDLSGLVIARIVEPNYFRLAGLTPELGTALSGGNDGIVITKQAAELMSIPINEGSLGEKLSLNVFYQDDFANGIENIISPDSPLVLRGIITDDLQPPTIFVLAQSFLQRPPFFKRALIKSADAEVIESLRDKLIEKGFIISARIDLVNQARSIMNIITAVLGVFGVVALIVSAIGMFNTMIVGFLERIYEVGIIKALGATDRDVRNLFLMESLVMGLLGGGGGVLLGVGIGEILNFGLNVLAKRLGGQPFDLFITPLWFVVMIIALSAFIGLFAGFWPARRASQLSPKEAFTK